MIDIANIPIGHIFPEASVIDRDIYNNRWILRAFQGNDIEKASFNKGNILQKTALILADKYVPPDMKIEEGKIVQNLIVIGKERRKLRVALKGYGKALKDHFYYKYSSDKSIETILGVPLENYSYTKSNIAYRPEKSNWKLWFNKWKEDCGKQFKNNFKVEEVDYNVDIPFLKLFIVRFKDYAFPVFGFKYISGLLGESLFYPGIVDKDGYSERSIYKTDSLCKFPRQFTAKIKNNTVSKEALVFLHGFTYPAKWHYGVWKHMLAVSPDAKENEYALWQKKLGINSFKRVDFKHCKPNQENTSCDEEQCVTLSLFKDIHPEIKDYCKLYLEQFVTLLELNTTNTITIFKDEFCYKIELICVHHTGGVYQKMVCRGVCYDWDNTVSPPVLHLVPVTMYLDKNQFLLCNNRNKSVFSGSLYEVRQCN